MRHIKRNSSVADRRRKLRMSGEKGNQVPEFDHFYSEFIREYDGNIILFDADKTYLTLTSCRPSDIGKNLRDIFSEKEYDLLQNYFDSYQGHPYHLNFIKIFTGFDNLFWKEHILIDSSRMTVKGRLLREHSDNLFPSDSSYRSAKKEVIILKKSHSGFTLDSVSESLTKNILLIKDKLLTNRKYNDLLEQCYEKGISVSRWNISLPCFDEKRYDIEIIPYHNEKHGGLTIILTESCSQDGFYFNQYESISESITHRYMIGCGSLKILQDKAVLFDEMNFLLSSLISEGKLRKKDITESAIFQNCIEQKTAGVGKIIIDDNNSLRHYIFGAYPFVKNSRTTAVSVFVIPTEPVNIICTDLLKYFSPRERNILRLTVEGYSTKDIAISLSISESTVKTILYHCYRKLNVKNRTEAVLKIYGLEHPL